MNPTGRRRLPWLVAAALCLVGGLWGGLLRLGVNLPLLAPSLPVAHGPLMVGGFLGTLIGVERAVAARRPWAWIAPTLTGAAGIGTLAGLPGAWGLLAAGGGGLLAVQTWIAWRQPSASTWTMVAGALAFVEGALGWGRGWPFWQVAPFWEAFLVLFIAGERLELSRIFRASRPQRVAWVFLVAAMAGAPLVALVHPAWGGRLLGVAMTGVVLWLVRADVIRHTVHVPGLPRWVAICAFLGYCWLVVAGSLLVGGGLPTAGGAYDATLHAVFVGFAFSMIFAHAPIILPALLLLPSPFGRALYVPLIGLHLSLVMRVAADLQQLWWIRAPAGLLGVGFILLFVVEMVYIIRRSLPGSSPRV